EPPRPSMPLGCVGHPDLAPGTHPPGAGIRPARAGRRPARREPGARSRGGQPARSGERPRAVGQARRRTRALPARRRALCDRGAPSRDHRRSGHEIWWKVWWPDANPHIAELRSKIGDAEFDQAWERGRAMTVHEAIDAALEETVRLEHALP